MPTETIEGGWQMIRAELGGEQAPDLVVQKTEIEFCAGTYTVRFDRQEADRGTYELSGTNNRRTVTLRSTSGTNPGPHDPGNLSARRGSLANLLRVGRNRAHEPCHGFPRE